MKLPELKKLMKENNIVGISYLNKPEIIQRLIEYKVLPEDYTNKQLKVKVKDDKYHIRNNPRSVEIFDRETGETTMFSSMHKAGRFFNKAARLIDANDGKVWRNRYEIKVSPKLKN